MKCVRVVGQGVPVRLTDEDALQLVDRDKDGEYCPKAFWKEWYDNHTSEAHRVRVYCKLNERGRVVPGLDGRLVRA